MSPPYAPLCDTIEMPPAARGRSQKYVPFRLTGAEYTPMQLGPTSRRPAARAVASRSRCVARPSSSTSPKPEDRITAARTRRAASALMASGTAGAGRLTSARSTASGSASMLGTVGRPRIDSPEGFTGWMAPPKPPSLTFCNNR